MSQTSLINDEVSNRFNRNRLSNKAPQLSEHQGPNFRINLGGLEKDIFMTISEVLFIFLPA